MHSFVQIWLWSRTEGCEAALFFRIRSALRLRAGLTWADRWGWIRASDLMLFQTTSSKPNTQEHAKVTWHVAKYGDPYSELVLGIYPILSAHTQQLTHTHTHTEQCTHTAVNTHTHTPWTQTRSSAHTHREHTPGAVHTHTVNTHLEQCTHTAVNTHTWSSGQSFMLRHLGSSLGFESAVLSFPPPTIPAGPRLEPATFGLRVQLSNY